MMEDRALLRGEVLLLSPRRCAGYPTMPGVLEYIKWDVGAGVGDGRKHGPVGA
jgi:hypothetical protein